MYFLLLLDHFLLLLMTFLLRWKPTTFLLHPVLKASRTIVRLPCQHSEEFSLTSVVRRAYATKHYWTYQHSSAQTASLLQILPSLLLRTRYLPQLRGADCAKGHQTPSSHRQAQEENPRPHPLPETAYREGALNRKRRRGAPYCSPVRTLFSEA